MKKTKRDGTMLLTLCAACVRQFYNSPEHIVRRANLNQEVKEPCCYCGCKNGWDYRLMRKRGGK